MKITKFNFPVMASWIQETGYRLDSKPFLSGAVEAKIVINRVRTKKQNLIQVTKNGREGIIHAGRSGRTYVDDPEFGVPFLGSKDIQALDFENLQLISKKQISDKPDFIIRENWILITRSGTIGRMAFVRPEMNGLACSEHVLRIIPDESKILSGYLFTYLCSKFGVSLITQGTYGAIIQHIEPRHITDLPIPRFGENFENQIHEKIIEAAKLRTNASLNILYIREEVEEMFQLWNNELEDTQNGLKTFIVEAGHLFKSKRFEATYHSTTAQLVEKIISKLDQKIKIKEVAKILKPGLFRRKFVEDPQFGIGLITGSDWFRVNPKPNYWVSPKTDHIQDCVLEPWWILIQAFGQVGGLIGHCVMVMPSLEGMAATDLQIQIRCQDPTDAGFIFSFFNTKAGYTLLSRLPIGGSIPHIRPEDIEDIEIPWPDKAIRKKIGQKILDAWLARQEADRLENEAIGLVENKIEELAK